MKNEHEFSQVNDYIIGVLTWNLAGNSPSSQMDFSEVLKSQKHKGKLPDIFIVGF